MAIERPLEKKTCDDIERKMQSGYQAELTKYVNQSEFSILTNSLFDWLSKTCFESVLPRLKD